MFFNDVFINFYSENEHVQAKLPDFHFCFDLEPPSGQMCTIDSVMVKFLFWQQKLWNITNSVREFEHCDLRLRI